MSLSRLVRCAICGEVADAAVTRICPGCGNSLTATPPQKPPVIQHSQREAQRDSSNAVLILMSLGLFLMVPYIFALANAAGLPFGIGLLLSAIAFTGGVVVAVKQHQSPAVRYYGDSQAVENPYESPSVASSYRPAGRSEAGQVVKTTLIVFLASLGLICVVAVGFIVFMFVACVYMVSTAGR